MKARRRLLPALLGSLVCALGIGATTAAADTQIFYKEFNGADSTGGKFNTYHNGPIEIDREAGVMYVRNRHIDGAPQGPPWPGTIDRFDLEGNAIKWPGSNSTSLSVPVGFFNGPGINPDKIAVDNSGTATQGRIYLTSDQLGVYGFKPNGEPISANFPFKPSQFCGISVDPKGGLWINYLNRIFGYSNEGVSSGTQYTVNGCPADFDNNGDIWAGNTQGVRKYNPAKEFTVYGPQQLVGKITGMPNEIAVDPVTNDVWVNYGTYIAGYHGNHTFAERVDPFEILSGFEKSFGHAFDADGNLYVADAGNPGDPNSTKVYIFRKGPASAPLIKRQAAQSVRSASVNLRAQVVTAGHSTTVHFEYGADSSYGSVTPAVEYAHRTTPYNASGPLTGLTPGETYHFRAVATNALGTTYGPDRVFSTFTIPPGGHDPCSNALARKQTGARALPDCRAYELVSARDTGGSDVESTLVPGQTPYPGFSDAENRALYALHAGAVPGSGNPTNRGPDPYLAVRGEDGWKTSYVGIPADINDVSGPFSSTLGEASSGLDSFAFVGEELCDPCFTSGIDTGIPVRLPNGKLVQGMAGSLNPVPATSSGDIAKRFSADGRHLVFGSTAKFEPDGNSGGSISIYVRDLIGGTTRVVSKTTDGQTMVGSGISQLDISDDGSRVTVAREVGEDANGNRLWNLYMTIGDADSSVALAPGASNGVYYNGQTADGGTVFFTSGEKLVGADTDSSADVYAAEVDSDGDVSLRLVSPSGAGSCDPVENADNTHWNSIGGTPTCNAVAIAGGGGVARDSGAFYFLSPEQLDGSAGTADEPNLYYAGPNGGIQFVATLEPNNSAVLNAIGDAEVRRLDEFQTNSNGAYALFASALTLTGADTGNGEVFRYDAQAEELDCVSCDPTGGESPDTAGDAFLSPTGMSLTEDGRSFFTTPGALVLNDSNGRLDVYQWSEGSPRLISSGISQFDSALHAVSADGTDAFFFTSDALAPTEDESGTRTRLYDARVNGGFFVIPPPAPCKASDECHGPGTVAPPPPPINSAVPTRVGNVKPLPKCKRNQVRKNGKCVKKNAGKKKKATKKASKKGNRKQAKRSNTRQVKRQLKGTINND